jgi:hypothetical protein
MKKLFKKLVFILAIVITPAIISADGYYWPSNFGPITLENISSQSDVREGSSTIELNITTTDENAIITADNSTTAQLKDTDGAAKDTLVTEYKLTFDGDGTGTKSGAADMQNYVEYNNFLLSEGIEVKYVPGDPTIGVTLWVRASNRAHNVADSGNYTATQTLTITWDGL